MSLDSPHPLFIVAVTIVAIILLMWTGKIWARRQVTRWCEREGYELVSFRGAWFYEGPRAWLLIPGCPPPVCVAEPPLHRGWATSCSAPGRQRQITVDVSVEACHSALTGNASKWSRANVARHDHVESRTCREANCASRRVGGMMSPSKSGPRAMLPIQEQSRCQRPSDMAAFLHQLSDELRI